MSRGQSFLKVVIEVNRCTVMNYYILQRTTFVALLVDVCVAMVTATVGPPRRPPPGGTHRGQGRARTQLFRTTFLNGGTPRGAREYCRGDSEKNKEINSIKSLNIIFFALSKF